MSFSIGSSSPGMGPRTALQNFGSNQREGEMFNRQVVSRMLKYLKPYRWRMTAALFLTLIESGLTLLSPYLLKEATDNHIPNKNYLEYTPSNSPVFIKYGQTVVQCMFLCILFNSRSNDSRNPRKNGEV